MRLSHTGIPTASNFSWIRAAIGKAASPIRRHRIDRTILPLLLLHQSRADTLLHVCLQDAEGGLVALNGQAQGVQHALGR
ncbi:MAG: hypothetical protein HUU20_25620, partial [Pirellulales bacterium]|nr:hypothetical protein [Pirellulales bacterium]